MSTSRGWREKKKKSKKKIQSNEKQRTKYRTQSTCLEGSRKLDAGVFLLAFKDWMMVLDIAVVRVGLPSRGNLVGHGDMGKSVIGIVWDCMDDAEGMGIAGIKRSLLHVEKKRTRKRKLNLQ
jgi:hypothetical protein